jgi:hypothetical protein
MLSRETISVISNIFHIWKLCLTAHTQHCDAKDLDDRSKSRLDALIGLAIEPIVAEYDALADRLGRSFANGDSE